MIKVIAHYGVCGSKVYPSTDRGCTPIVLGYLNRKYGKFSMPAGALNSAELYIFTNYCADL